MNNDGKLNNPEAAAGDEKNKGGKTNPWLLLGVIGIFIVLGGVILMRAAPILIGIISPPMPPLPEGVRQYSHRAITHGVDEWTYESDLHACMVLEYYYALADNCRGAYLCADNPNYSPLPTHQNVSQCTGHIDFSLFTMQWIATIEADKDGRSSVFQVSRETFWGGKIPPIKMDDLLEQTDLETP